MDVIDEDEELNCINDGTPMETPETKNHVSKTDKTDVDPAIDEGQNSGLKPSDPLDLDSSEAEKPTINQSRLPPPTLEETERSVEKTTEDDVVLDIKDDSALRLEEAGVFPWLACVLSPFFMSFVD
jgi:hypothetical protein